MSRVCYRCEQPDGVGLRELRPYGPGGRDVCAECVFGKDRAGPNAKLLATAERQLKEQLLTSEPLVLDVSERVGPRPIVRKKA